MLAFCPQLSVFQKYLAITDIYYHSFCLTVPLLHQLERYFVQIEIIGLVWFFSHFFQLKRFVKNIVVFIKNVKIKTFAFSL